VILEAIVTTVDEYGCVNLAPMGPTHTVSPCSGSDSSSSTVVSDHQGSDSEPLASVGADENSSEKGDHKNRVSPSSNAGQEFSKATRETRVPASETHVDGFILRPFKTSKTYSNLSVNPFATIHVTDDSLLFAKSAVAKISNDEKMSLVHHLEGTHWWPLRDCHRWFAVEVMQINEDPMRVSMNCRVIRSREVRPFFGFNRAKHAVIEAAILATRTHLLPREDVMSEIERLLPLVEKTGGPDEHTAFQLLETTIQERYAKSQ